ncbi:MAG TPA: dihydropteroate synthase [Sulfurospirillum sp. UBA11407]|nr:MAG TPA: dihydropteroate synthase [Sulfurospirillum sp. UBA11407]
MKLLKINTKANIQKLLEKIGVTKEGMKILESKAQLHFVYIKDLKTPAANILKQDALSIGADLAVSADTITCKEKFTDALLIASTRELKTLSKKELAQPFGLKEVAKGLGDFLYKEQKKPRLMGVLNANEDSFFQKSRFDATNAFKKMNLMIEDGADIIDIGGVSSRPGSMGVSEEEELNRIKPIVDLIYEHKLFDNVTFSLDSYSALCLNYALDRGFSIVNDITALAHDEVARVAAKYDATVVLMHMKGIPLDMQSNPYYEDVLEEVDTFFAQRIAKAKSFGINKIVLDVGIGFGKSLEHNLLLLNHHEHFLHFGYELLVGASRKSMIDKIVPCSVEERLPGTLAIHLKALENGASIIRAHDVKEHYQAMQVWEKINEATL